MTRLDSHIANVRNRLTLTTFLSAWAWAALGMAAMVWAIIIGERLLDLTIGHWEMILLGGAIVTAAGAFAFSLTRRPTAELAAVRIDETLGLKEKFSTALFARNVEDPFAQAAVLDAEQTAGNVSLYKRFPLKFPSQAIGAGAVFLLALLTAEFMPAMHLFAKPPVIPPKPAITIADLAQNKKLQQELPKIEEASQVLKDNPDIKRAQDELNDALKTKEGDDLKAKRSTLLALQDYKKALTEELNKNENFQTAIDEQSQLSQMSSAPDETTPIGKAQNEMKNGDLEGAIRDLNKAVTDFDKMSPQDQQKMVQQAQQLAQQLAKAANNPSTSQHIAQQLQQMGATQQQAQQMAQAMQQAAQGNQQAQQQVQQMAKQMQQQMNNGQGPTSQQMQQIQSLMAHAQGLANSQAQAQSMSGAAQQMAQAMQQAQQGQQGQAQGQQGQSQQGASAQQSMASAQQSLQQQMQQMEAMAKDAEAMQAARDAAQQGQDAAGDAMADSSGSSGQPGDGSGDDQSKQGGKDDNQNGLNQGQGGGALGPGGSKMNIVYAPGQTKQELDPSADNPNGKILASRNVKAPIDPGTSVAGTHDEALSADKDAADEVDDDHVSREAQQAVKTYFSSMQQDQQ
ncbi:MAG: hypothetical protein ABSG31_05865 [Tepidisphaeraceae bacterium]|jgi:hypothetical protein